MMESDLELMRKNPAA